RVREGSLTEVDLSVWNVLVDSGHRGSPGPPDMYPSQWKPRTDFYSRYGNRAPGIVWTGDLLGDLQVQSEPLGNGEPRPKKPRRNEISAARVVALDSSVAARE